MNDTNYQEPLSDADFNEILIRHMVLSPDINTKTRGLKLSSDDMMVDDSDSSILFRELIKLIQSIEMRPIPANSLITGLMRKFEDGTISKLLIENTLELLEYFYDESRPLERAEWFDGKISTFLKNRRAAKVIKLYQTDIPTLTRELNRLNVSLAGDSEMSRPRIINPFVEAVYKTKTVMVGTGLPKLDEKLDGGLLRGEYAMLIGFSGGGKTAVGSNIIGASAELGHPSTYVSCEEHENEISQRFYSRVYRIPYRQLRSGCANIELESKFNADMRDFKKEMLAKNLSLIGLKGIDEDITSDFLYEVLLQHYEKTGFVPVKVMLDQLQCLVPSTSLRKSIQTWEIEKVVAVELDELSHRQIGGKGFVLWVQHQAKGKTKEYFTREEIDGFKGIIHKPDLVLGCGRASQTSNQISLFPLKVRHSADFKLTLQTQFEYMTVTSVQVMDSLSGQDEANNGLVDSMTRINHSAIPTTQFK